MSSPQFLIVGATGKQGSAALGALTDAGIPASSIRFLTRKPSSATASLLTKKGHKAIQGDLSKPETLGAALEGVDRAFLVTDVRAGKEAEISQGINFIDVAKNKRVKHIVFTSVADADVATEVPHFASKYEIEKHLVASGLSYTILRPVAFMDNFGVANSWQRYLTLGIFFAAANWQPVQFIAVEDIGVVAGKALADPENANVKNQKIDLSAGPYALEDVLKAYSSAQGEKPGYAWFIPPSIVHIAPHDMKMMMLYFRNKGFALEDPKKAKLIHPGLMTFEQWVAKNSNG